MRGNQRDYMKKDGIEALVRDFLASCGGFDDPELRAVEATLFLEDCLDLSVSDADMQAARLDTDEGLARFIQTRMGV